MLYLSAVEFGGATGYGWWFAGDCRLTAILGSIAAVFLIAAIAADIRQHRLEYFILCALDKNALDAFLKDKGYTRSG